MATYAIGDVQGCYEQLVKRLDDINFDPTADELWFVGDLVNRGPQSLETLRFVKGLGSQATVVLGNHDLHLLSRFYTSRPAFGDDTLQDIIDAPDVEELCHWLRHQPLLHFNKDLNILMVHAGIIPEWSIEKALLLAKEVETELQTGDFIALLFGMYGDQPDKWSNGLTGIERLRFIINVFTRIRFCSAHGQLNLTSKAKVEEADGGDFPWFELPGRHSLDTKIVFGHWAALGGTQGAHNVWGIDTGCVWGGELTILDLESI